MKWQKKERIVELMISSTGLISVVVLLLIGIFLFKESSLVFYRMGVTRVIFGLKWYPTSDPPLSGMLPLIAGTLSVTLLTAVMAIPLGLATSVYIAIKDFSIFYWDFQAVKDTSLDIEVNRITAMIGP